MRRSSEIGSKRLMRFSMTRPPVPKPILVPRWQINALAQELGGVNQKLSVATPWASSPQPCSMSGISSCGFIGKGAPRRRCFQWGSHRRPSNSAGAGALISGGEVRILGLQLDPIAEDRAAFT